MRIASTGDIHLTEGARGQSTLDVLDWIIDDAVMCGADTLTIGGDLCGVTVPHRGSPWEKHQLALRLHRAAQFFPVAINRGNHDFLLDYDHFELIGQKHPIIYCTQPTLVHLKEVTLLMAPYPFKHQWLTRKASSIAEQNAIATEEYLAELLRKREEFERLDRGGVPIVLVGHFNIVGAQVGGGEVLSGHEVELTEEQVLKLDCHRYLISHIHKAQDFGGGRINFIGSPSAQSFGEQTDRKLYLVTNTEESTVERRYTPAPVLWTIEARYERGEWIVGWPLDDSFVGGSECRLHYVVPEEFAATADPTPIIAELERRGVKFVKPEPQVIPMSRVRSEGITRAETVHQKLDAWCATQEPAVDEETRARLHTRLSELEA